MKIIRADRGAGKTTELIRKSNKEWKYIVCVDKSRADNIVNMAMRMGLDIPYPITIRELPLKVGQRINSVLIDELDENSCILNNIYLDKIHDCNTFLSIEPILEKAGFGLGPYVDWIIVGAETGNRKGKVIPKKEWIMNIKEQCKKAGVPLFMKESLRELMGQDFVQEFPWDSGE